MRTELSYDFAQEVGDSVEVVDLEVVFAFFDCRYDSCICRAKWSFGHFVRQGLVAVPDILLGGMDNASYPSHKSCSMFGAFEWVPCAGMGVGSDNDMFPSCCGKGAFDGDVHLPFVADGSKANGGPVALEVVD